MRREVVDTNVLLVANGDHGDISEACEITCIEKLLGLKRSGVIVIDDEWRILGEYQSNLPRGRGQPGPGDVFLKWLLQRRADARYVREVSVTESGDDWFDEFPDHAVQGDFDAPDRKFVAVAAADAGNPTILQAADCKWLEWWQPLSTSGINFSFVCRDDVERFYTQKFPDRPVPNFPPDE